VASWVGSISYEQRDNWEICKQRSLFGSNVRTALGVRAGDELFIYGAEQGWLGRCLVTADAHRPTEDDEIPWPDPERYVALLPMKLLDEPSPPLQMTTAERIAVAGVPNVRLAQFPQLDPIKARALTRMLGGRPGAVSPFEQELERLLADPAIPPGYDDRNRSHRSIVQRRGQKAFRDSLVRAYDGRCAITGTAGEAVLEAAHIRPYRGQLHNRTNNGLLLRADIHTLFDLWKLTVVPSGTIRVRPSLADPLYAGLDGQPVRWPASPDARPLASALEDHNAKCPWL
jgi:hypothetical protein